MRIPRGAFSWMMIILVSGISTTISASHAPDSSLARRITIAAVGDIMFGTSFPSERYLPPHDNPLLLLGSLADTLKSADVTFGNLEGSFLDEGMPAKQCRDTLKCYLFRMPERYAVTLSDSGFDLISLANNHSGDFGEAGREKTMDILDSLGISYAGLISEPAAVFVKDSIRYGFCAFAPNAGTLNINDIPSAARLVEELSSQCDILIVSFHGGAEGAEYQRIPGGNELFYGESRGDVIDFSHKMIDAGADLVFGHGPHVTRAVEVYRDRFIAYSLGNFCTYGRFNLSGPNGIAPIVKIRVDQNGKFISGRIIPVKQSWDTGVRYDPAAKVIGVVRELVKLDFSDSGTEISGTGEIIYNK